MSAMDPTEIFRQEASELFEVLEGALLDLGLRPDDRELVDSAFRALHTIKGSGAMFGFDKVASFTHEFETAFDRVRKGEIKPTQELISVALAAKDYIRALIEDPQSTDDIIGEAILDDLKRFVFPDQAAAPVAEVAVAPPLVPAESKQAGWHLYLEFESHILRNGSNPLDLLEDLCKLGPCFVVPVTDGIPFLDEMEPEDCYLKWDVKLHAACDKDAIDDVFMFVSDEMKLTLSPLEQIEAPAPMPLFNLLDDEPAVVAEIAAPVAEAVVAPVVEVAATPVAAQPAVKAEPKSEPKPEAKRDDRGIATVRVQAERLDELMDRVGETRDRAGASDSARFIRLRPLDQDDRRGNRTPRVLLARHHDGRAHGSDRLAVRPIPPPRARSVARSVEAGRFRHDGRGHRGSTRP